MAESVEEAIASFALLLGNWARAKVHDELSKLDPARRSESITKICNRLARMAMDGKGDPAEAFRLGKKALKELREHDEMLVDSDDPFASPTPPKR
jgi:hypothetical protein